MLLKSIADFTQKIRYRVSRELADLLQPLDGNKEYHAENSQDLVKEMTMVTSQKKESRLCDVILRRCPRRLENDKTLKNRTKPWTTNCEQHTLYLDEKSTNRRLK